MNRGTARWVPADNRPGWYAAPPTWSCRNEVLRFFWTSGGASDCVPAMLLLFGRFVGIASSTSTLSDLSDMEPLCSISDEGGVSLTTSKELLFSAESGGLDTFLGLCRFATRHLMCTYSLLLESGRCGGRDMMS